MKKRDILEGAIPLGVLKFDVPLTEETLTDIKSRWMDMYGGADNWSDVGVLDQGFSYQRIGFNFYRENEMGAKRFGWFFERHFGIGIRWDYWSFPCIYLSPFHS